MDMDLIIRIGLIALVAIAVLTAMPGPRGTAGGRDRSRGARSRWGTHLADFGTFARADHTVGHHSGRDGAHDGGPGGGHHGAG